MKEILNSLENFKKLFFNRTTRSKLDFSDILSLFDGLAGKIKLLDEEFDQFNKDIDEKGDFFINFLTIKDQNKLIKEELTTKFDQIHREIQSNFELYFSIIERIINNVNEIIESYDFIRISSLNSVVISINGGKKTKGLAVIANEITKLSNYLISNINDFKGLETTIKEVYEQFTIDIKNISSKFENLINDYEEAIDQSIEFLNSVILVFKAIADDVYEKFDLNKLKQLLNQFIEKMQYQDIFYQQYENAEKMFSLIENIKNRETENDPALFHFIYKILNYFKHHIPSSIDQFITPIKMIQEKIKIDNDYDKNKKFENLTFFLEGKEDRINEYQSQIEKVHTIIGSFENLGKEIVFIQNSFEKFKLKQFNIESIVSINQESIEKLSTFIINGKIQITRFQEDTDLFIRSKDLMEQISKETVKLGDQTNNINEEIKQIDKDFLLIQKSIFQMFKEDEDIQKKLNQLSSKYFQNIDVFIKVISPKMEDLDHYMQKLIQIINDLRNKIEEVIDYFENISFIDALHKIIEDIENYANEQNLDFSSEFTVEEMNNLKKLFKTSLEISDLIKLTKDSEVKNKLDEQYIKDEDSNIILF